MTSEDARSITYQLAKKFNLKHNFNNETRMAGENWLAAFLKCNKMTLRKPEHTSSARANGFNEQSVTTFYNRLEKIRKENIILPQNIYNFDETPVTTVPKRARKVIASKGKKQFGGLVSGERGEHVTVGVCLSAMGTVMPPFLIFLRHKSHPDYFKGKSEGSSIVFDPKGYINLDLFH